LPNVGPYIYDVSISGFTRSSIYVYYISSLRVNPSSQSDNILLGLPFSVTRIDFFRILPLQFQFRPIISPTTFLALITFLLHLLFFPVHCLDILCCSVSISSFHPPSIPSSLSSRFLFWHSAISRSLPVMSLVQNVWKSI